MKIKKARKVLEQYNEHIKDEPWYDGSWSLNISELSKAIDTVVKNLKKKRMKASDLRIGNYIEHDMSVDDWKVIKLGIGDLTMFWEECKNGEDREHITYIPIPLTEEWLKKFGFEFWGSSKIFADRCDFWCLDKGIEEECFYCKHLEINIVYVHQLQNIYHSLTGEELILKRPDFTKDRITSN